MLCQPRSCLCQQAGKIWQVLKRLTETPVRRGYRSGCRFHKGKGVTSHSEINGINKSQAVEKRQAALVRVCPAEHNKTNNTSWPHPNFYRAGHSSLTASVLPQQWSETPLSGWTTRSYANLRMTSSSGSVFAALLSLQITDCRRSERRRGWRQPTSCQLKK